MDANERPVIHCLVGWVSDVFGILGDEGIWPRVLTLEEAADYALAGAMVVIDPFDRDEFLLYERIQRSMVQPEKPKWFEQS